MPKVTPIQESFAAGEISPLLLGRRSIEGYKSGAATMSNMLANPRGPAESRGGFRFNQSFAGNDARVGTLNTNASAELLFLMTDLLVTITGIQGELPQTNFIVNGDFAASGANWLTGTVGGGSSVIFSVGACDLDGGGVGSSAYISQQLALSTVGIHPIIVETDGATAYRIKVGTTENSNDIFELVTSAAQRRLDVDIQILNPFFSIERLNSDGGPANIVLTRLILTDDITQQTFVTPYPESVLKELFFVESPDGKAVYILHYNYAPHKLTIDSGGIVTLGIVVFTAPPASWDGTNWPQAGTVFAGRLWLGGTPLDAQTFWGSKSGDLENFTLGENADDALEFTISRFGAIVWMMGTKNLLIGTVNGEHVVSSEAGVITPTDIRIDQQSAYGSSRVQPAQVGDQIFYVSLDATKVRAMQYEWSADNWLSKDLTFFSNHITRSGIREISWAPNPGNDLVCTLNNGTAAVLSYERGENVWGWSRHETQGDIKDSAVGVQNGFSFLVLFIKRVSGELYLETQLATYDTHMDSWIEQEDLITPFTVVVGLGHLEGMEVQVVQDGAVAPDQVVTGGQITLATPAFHVEVGLQFIPKLVTLPLESGSPTGSSLAYLKRYNRIIVGLLNSALPLINGIRGPDRTPSTPMNTVEPNTTGLVSSYQLGWSEGAIVTIEQDLPLALTVLYIGGELPQDVL